MRSPSCQARTVRAVPIGSAASSASPPLPIAADTSQSPKRALPGTSSLAGRGGGASGSRVKRNVPYSATARRPSPRSSEALPPRSPRCRMASAWSRDRAYDPPEAASARRRRTSRARPGGNSRSSPMAGARSPRRASASSTAASSTSASSRSSRLVSTIERSADGLSSLSAGSTSSRTRARAKRGSAFDTSSTHSSPRAVQCARVSSRVAASSGRTSRPRRGSMPSSARRPGDTARR